MLAPSTQDYLPLVGVDLRTDDKGKNISSSAYPPLVGGSKSPISGRGQNRWYDEEFKTKKDKPVKKRDFKIQQIDINWTKQACAGCTALTPLPNPLPQGARG